MELLHQEGELPSGIFFLGLSMGDIPLSSILLFLRTFSGSSFTGSKQTLDTQYHLKPNPNLLHCLLDQGLPDGRAFSGLSHLTLSASVYTGLGRPFDR